MKKTGTVWIISSCAGEQKVALCGSGVAEKAPEFSLGVCGRK